MCSSTNIQATNSWKYLESPKYPDQYPNNKHCGINIFGSCTKCFIELEIVEVEVEKSYDYVWIYNKENGEQLGELTGSYDGGANYKSMRNTMYIKFKSDGSVTKKGFRFKFRQYAENRLQSKHIKWHNIQHILYLYSIFLCIT